MAELSTDAYWRAPPIARTVATITFGLSCAVHTGVLAGDLFYYDFRYLLRFPPQVWRIVTCFLITFPNLGILFDTFHMYMYMSQLERGHPRLSRREDFVWYLTFVSGTILVGLFSSISRASPCTLMKTPQNICPDSAMPLLLSRFLELRKITPALRVGSLIRIRIGLRCGHGGMS